ncbi:MULTISPECIES: hypothetical protein [unclassified Bradyrhizobium]|nr:hypothetical protein [Bradyrhizobium sp. USDA 4541]MCP1851201.1 hypothetical protein [Bradyrhizobium sp. USDA 4541]
MACSGAAGGIGTRYVVLLPGNVNATSGNVIGRTGGQECPPCPALRVVW